MATKQLSFDDLIQKPTEPLDFMGRPLRKPQPLPVLPPDPTDADIDHWLREIAEEDAIESGIRERKVTHDPR